MPKRKRLQDLLARQNNARGMGLARDVKAGQAAETPYSQARKRARRRGSASYYRPGGTRRA